MGLPIISSVLSIGEKLIDKLIPDPKAKAEALQKLTELEQSGDLQVIANQIEINKLEAVNPRLFVSGWRPAVGWVCVAALAYALVLSPMIAGVAMLFGKAVAMPVISVELLTTLLVGMLGLGGMRTVEKLNKVETK